MGYSNDYNYGYGGFYSSYNVWIFTLLPHYYYSMPVITMIATVMTINALQVNKMQWVIMSV